MSALLKFACGVIAGAACGVTLVLSVAAEEGADNKRIIYEEIVVHPEPLTPRQETVSSPIEKKEAVREDSDADADQAQMMKQLKELLEKVLKEGNSEGLVQELFDSLSAEEEGTSDDDSNSSFKDWEDRHEWEGIRKE